MAKISTTQAAVERFERDQGGDGVRRRGAFKLLGGIGLFVLGGMLVFVGISLGEGPGARSARMAAAGIFIIGMLGSVMGLQQWISGRSWSDLSQRTRILVLCLGIPFLLIFVFPLIGMIIAFLVMPGTRP